MNEEGFDFFPGLPRDIRFMLGMWLGPCPLIRVRARAVCKAWMEWVPCDLDMYRNEETGVMDLVMPVRWSLTETVLYLVLREPDEVCARFDNTFACFANNDDDYEPPFKGNTTAYHVVREAVLLRKVSVLDSLLCNAHLSEDRTWGANLDDGFSRRILVRATLLNRVDILLRYRFLLWVQPVIFRQRLTWMALFYSSREIFATLLTRLGCGRIRPWQWRAFDKYFTAKAFGYLNLTDDEKRAFLDKAVSMPSECALLKRLEELHLTIPADRHNVAAITDLQLRRNHGLLTRHEQDQCKALYLTPYSTNGFVSRTPGIRSPRADDDDDDSSSSSSSSSSSRSSNSGPSDGAYGSRDVDFCCYPDDIRKETSMATELLTYGRSCTEQEAARRVDRIKRKWGPVLHPVRLYKSVPWARGNAPWERSNAIRCEDKEEAALAAAFVAKHPARPSMSIHALMKRMRPGVPDASEPRPPKRVIVRNPYEESMDSSEEARIMEEEEELEFALDDDEEAEDDDSDGE